MIDMTIPSETQTGTKRDEQWLWKVRKGQRNRAGVGALLVICSGWLAQGALCSV